MKRFIFILLLPMVCFGAGNSYVGQFTGDGSGLTNLTGVSGGSATNAPWPLAGTNVTAQTNGLEVTINADVGHTEVSNATNGLRSAILGLLGTAAYSNSAVFYPSNNPAGFAPSNSLGTAAYQASGAFQAAGSYATAAQLADATNHTLPGTLFPTLSGDITTPGASLATMLKSTGTAGTYTKTTFDAQGRETSGTTLSAGDIPAIAESGVTGLVGDLAAKAPAQSGTIVTQNNSFSLVLSNAVKVDAASKLSLSNLTASALVKAGADNTVVSGDLSGDVTTSGTLATTLKSTGTAGTYRSVTFDAQGRETSGSNPTTFSGYGLSDTSANLAAALTDETGSGLAVFGTSPTIVTPTIASFANANHNHQNSAGGGALDAAAITSGTIAPARLGSGSGGATKFLREDSTFQTVSAGGSQTPWAQDIDGGGFKLTNVAGASVTSLTNSGLTASRVMLTDGNKAESSAAASGAVPIDADGSATTFAQVNALAPGYVATNGNLNVFVQSNHFKVDVTHSLFVSNATASRIAVIGADNTVTNLNSIDGGTALQLSGNKLIPLSTEVITNGATQNIALGGGLTNNSAAGFNGNGIGLTNTLKRSVGNITGITITTTSRIMSFDGSLTAGNSAANGGPVESLIGNSPVTIAYVGIFATTGNNGTAPLSTTNFGAILVTNEVLTSYVVGFNGDGTTKSATSTTPFTIPANARVGWYITNAVSTSGGNVAITTLYQ